MNVLIFLQYDGTAYHGFQIQNNAETVQDVLQKAVYELTHEKICVLGCGRTDAGVHAVEYAAMFKTESKIPLDKIPLALNSVLPDDIRVYDAKYVSDSFHPVFSLLEKTYRYTIINRAVNDVFLRRFAWFVPGNLDIDKMRHAAKHFLGVHDFSGFMSSGSNVSTTVRNIKRLDIEEKSGRIDIYVSADGFLYNMVRIITGTLVAVGQGRIDDEDIPEIIASADRKRAGATAPPEGLALYKIKYSEEELYG